MTTVIALGTTERESSPITIPSGSTYSFVLFTPVGVSPPAHGGGVVVVDTPGADVVIAELDAAHRYSASIPGPLTVIVKVPASEIQLGVEQYS